eukprot:358129-Chlamydomonas_euryale.AAC.1
MRTPTGFQMCALSAMMHDVSSGHTAGEPQPMSGAPAMPGSTLASTLVSTLASTLVSTLPEDALSGAYGGTPLTVAWLVAGGAGALAATAWRCTCGPRCGLVAAAALMAVGGGVCAGGWFAAAGGQAFAVGRLLSGVGEEWARHDGAFTLSFRRHSWRVHAEKGKLEAKLRPHARWTKKHDDAITTPRQLVPATAPYPVPA